LITSQEEHDINALLDTSDSNKVDVAAFFHSEMGKSKSIMASHLNGLVRLKCTIWSKFQLDCWASLATNLIRTAYDPNKRLEVLLQGSAHGTAESVLDALYATALDAAGQWDDDDFVVDFQCILGVVLTTRTSLSDEIIDHLLHLHRQRLSKGLLSRIKCLLI
jgi:hypothetical protein